MQSTADCNAKWSAPRKLYSSGINTDPDVVRVSNTDYVSVTHHSPYGAGEIPTVKTLSATGKTTVFSPGNGPAGEATHFSAASPSRVIMVYGAAGRLPSWAFNGRSQHHTYLTGANRPRSRSP